VIIRDLLKTFFSFVIFFTPQTYIVQKRIIDKILSQGTR